MLTQQQPYTSSVPLKSIEFYDRFIYHFIFHPEKKRKKQKKQDRVKLDETAYTNYANFMSIFFFFLLITISLKFRNELHMFILLQLKTDFGIKLKMKALSILTIYNYTYGTTHIHKKKPQKLKLFNCLLCLYFPQNDTRHKCQVYNKKLRKLNFSNAKHQSGTAGIIFVFVSFTLFSLPSLLLSHKIYFFDSLFCTFLIYCKRMANLIFII